MYKKNRLIPYSLMFIGSLLKMPRRLGLFLYKNKLRLLLTWIVCLPLHVGITYLIQQHNAIIGGTIRGKFTLEGGVLFVGFFVLVLLIGIFTCVSVTFWRKCPARFTEDTLFSMWQESLGLSMSLLLWGLIFLTFLAIPFILLLPFYYTLSLYVSFSPSLSTYIQGSIFLYLLLLFWLMPFVAGFIMAYARYSRKGIGYCWKYTTVWLKQAGYGLLAKQLIMGLFFALFYLIVWGIKKATGASLGVLLEPFYAKVGFLACMQGFLFFYAMAQEVFFAENEETVFLLGSGKEELFIEEEAEDVLDIDALFHLSEEETSGAPDQMHKKEKEKSSVSIAKKKEKRKEEEKSSTSPSKNQ